MSTKIIAITSLVCALVAGGTAWQQRRAASELEKQVAYLQSVVTKKSGEIKDQEALVHELRQQNNTYLEESAALREKLLARTSNTTSVENDVVAGPSPNPSLPAKRQLAKLFDDPKTKKIFRQQQQLQLKGIFSDFVKERGLNAQQSEQFFDLLTEGSISNMEEGMKLLDGDRDRESSKDTEDTTDGKFAGQLRTLLGDANYAAYQAYKEGIGDRMALAQVREQISMAGSPLRDEQAKTLLAVMTEEHSRTVAHDLDKPGNVREQMAALLDPRKADDYVAARAETNQRILSRMAGTLSQEQYEAFERILQQQLEMEKISLEFARDYMQDSGNDESHSYYVVPGH